MARLSATIAGRERHRQGNEVSVRRRYRAAEEYSRWRRPSIRAVARSEQIEARGRRNPEAYAVYVEGFRRLRTKRCDAYRHGALALGGNRSEEGDFARLNLDFDTASGEFRVGRQSRLDSGGQLPILPFLR